MQYEIVKNTQGKSLKIELFNSIHRQQFDSPAQRNQFLIKCGFDYMTGPIRLITYGYQPRFHYSSS